jgi:hypothetical protein
MPVPSQGHYGFHSFPVVTDFVCLYTYEFRLSLWKIVRSLVILLLPLCSKLTEYSSHIPVFEESLFFCWLTM